MAQPSSPADVLGIFVRAPVAGAVKTRLARAIGDEPAAALYRDLGRTIVRQCIGPDPYRAVVWFTPAGCAALVRSWLANAGVEEFRAQRSGGLGARLAAAFHRHFSEGAEHVVIVGSDCPGVGRFQVRRSFRLLERADLVLGRASDGGFYLIGLRRPVPGLFRCIGWSSDAVFRQTMRNAARLRLATAVLPELRDVDTVDDARALGLLTEAARIRAGRSSPL